VGRVLLLCPPGEAADLRFLLEDAGHEVVHAPGREPTVALLAAAEQAGRCAWLVATSASALGSFLEAVSRVRGRAALAGCRWVVVDAASAAALERRGLAARRVVLEELDGTLAALFEAGDEVLLVSTGRGLSLHETQGAGARVTSIVVEAPAPLEVGVDLVVVHSLLAAERLADRRPEEGGLAPAFVASEPLVAEVLRTLGLPVVAVADGPDAGSLADAALRLLSR
jgi:uroporphyrinogen-III synthase